MAAVAIVAGNVPEEAEAGMFTEGGTTKAGSLLETETATPPLGAGPERVIVQVLLEPVVRFVGLQVNAFSCSGSSVKVTVPARSLFEALPIVAVMVTLTLVVTVPADAVKVAEVAPEGTGREAGMASRELLSVK